MAKITKIRLPFRRGEIEVYHEYEIGKPYSSLGELKEIIEHKENSHYELIFGGASIAHLNIFPKTGLFVTKEM